MKTNDTRNRIRVLIVTMLASFCMYECMCGRWGGDTGNGCGPEPCETTADCPQGEYCCPDKYCHECCLESHCPDNLHCCDDDYECHQCCPYHHHQCPENTYCCEDFDCHQCCDSTHCPFYPDEYCSDGYSCIPICPDEGDFCHPDTRACCSWLICDQYLNECVPPCENDTDCHDRPMRHAGDLKCADGICDFEHCAGDQDCPAGKICFDGNCLTPLDCAQLSYCKVKPSSAVMHENTSIRLSAATFLRSHESTPVLGYNWSSSNASVAGVDADGVVTGASGTGAATITATVAGCATSCQAVIINHAVATGTRIVAVDEFSGTPVAGATVAIGAETPVSTDENGAANFAVELSPANPGDITVSHDEYNYVTLNGAESGDVVIHLTPILDPAAAGGIWGRFDYSKIQCPGGADCSVRMGIAGLSMPGNLMNMDFGRMTADWLCSSDPDSGLPERFQLCENGSCTQEFYTATGQPGLRVAWGFAGKIGLGDLIDILEPVLSGTGDPHQPSLLASLVALYSDFYTCLISDVEIVAGEHKRLDMLPDVAMRQALTVASPPLPPGVYDGVLVYAGVIVQDAGLVILGTAAGVDSTGPDDPADGTIEGPIVLSASYLNGRIPEDQVQRVVIAMALDLSQADAPKTYSLQILFLDSFEGSHQLDPFLLPAQATYDPSTRHLEMLQSPPADCFQITFSDENNAKWQILGETAASIDLPPAPPEGDRANRATVIAVDLIDGATYQALPQFNDTNLGNLIRLVQALSYTEIP